MTTLENGTEVLEYIIDSGDSADHRQTGVVNVASTPVRGDLPAKEYSGSDLAELFQNASSPLVSVSGLVLPAVVWDDVKKIVFHNEMFEAHPDLVEFGNATFPERLHEGAGYTNGTNLRVLKKEGDTLELGLMKFFDYMRYANFGGRSIFPSLYEFEHGFISDITDSVQTTLWELDVTVHKLRGQPYDVSTALVPHYFGGGIAALPNDGGMIFVGQRSSQRDGITKASGGDTWGVGGYTIRGEEYLKAIADGSLTVEDVVAEHVQIHALQKLGISGFETVKTIYVLEPGCQVSPITFIRPDMTTRQIAESIAQGPAGNVQYAVARLPLTQEDLRLATSSYRFNAGSLGAAGHAADNNLNPIT